MRIGVDYYPEQWDKSFWEADADYMKKTGVTTVRIAEFSWSRLEPREGEFDFSWLDEVISLFAERGIEVVLGTPSNCPPLWLYKKYEDAIQVDEINHRIALGIRGHRCYNSPSLRYFTYRIVEKMCARYGKNKAVIGWQIDNELEANFCRCSYCTEKFREWMRKKYKTIDAVNRAYQNVVWSGEYSEFEEITPPFGPFKHWKNPSFMLDYNRYASDSMVDFVEFQASIIRQNTTNQFVTTNTFMCENMPDFYQEFKGLDFVSYDNYPVNILPEDKEEIYSHAFHLDLMRGIKKKNFWVMEQLSGMVGSWTYMSPTPRPGMIKGYTMQAIAHGADAVLHFRYRSAKGGAEMFWHGLIDVSNKPGRRYFEFADACKEIKKLQELDGTYIKNEVALLYSPEDEYAFKIQLQEKELYYYQALKAFHNACTSLGVGVDVIHKTENLTGYKVVIAPTLFIEDKQVTRKLYEFVKQGGICILTYRSGVKDENNVCIMDALPTVFKELAGCEVSECDGIGERTGRIAWENGESFTCRTWCELLELKGAKALATYQDCFYENVPAITKNHYGDGMCYYVGCVGERNMYREVVQAAFDDAGVIYETNLPFGLEITKRENETTEYFFYFNNSNERVSVVSKDNDENQKELQLEPFEMKILSKRKG